MERISVNGEEYVKASSIARELGYTSDYVGQLCRAGKVDAERVGRNWFVNEQSIRDHKKDRYRSTVAKSRQAIQKSFQKPAEDTTPRTLRENSHFYQKAVQNQDVQYEPDSHDLIPSPGKKEQQAVSEPEQAKASQTTEEEKKEASATAEEPTPHEDTNEAAAPAAAEQETTVPVRTQTMSRRHTAPTRQRRMHEARLKQQQKAARQPMEEGESVVTPSHPSAVPTLMVVSVAFCIALVGTLALIGLEGRVVADGSYTSDTYRFNMATAFESIKNSQK